jgi:hypothetical protein
VEVLLTMLYIARHTTLEYAIAAAEVITGHKAWGKYGGREFAVLDLPEFGGGMFWLCDLTEVPEGRPMAVAIVKEGKRVE